MTAEDAADAAVRARLQLLSQTFCLFPSWCFRNCSVCSLLVFQAPLLCHIFPHALRWILEHGPRDHPSVLRILRENGEAA